MTYSVLKFYIPCIFIFLFFSQKLQAHQPVLNDSDPRSRDDPYVIEEPEVSKAIFSILQGEPHYYRLLSNTEFFFYVGITTPKLEGCGLIATFSFDVLDDAFKVIETFDGTQFHWWKWYEKFGRNWYWIGPEMGKDFKANRLYPAGTYYIRVYNASHQGKYVLAVGDIEDFPLSVIVKLPFTIPVINSTFWDEEDCEHDL